MSTSPQAGPVDGSQSLWALWATPGSGLLRETDKLQQLQLGRFAGAPSWTLRFESLMGDPRPARPVVGARPVGSRAVSASTGATRHQRRPGRTGGGAVENEYRFYVGIDWASEAHQACVLDQARRIVSERGFAHAGDALAAFASGSMSWPETILEGPPSRSRFLAAQWSRPWSRGASTSTLSIPNSSIASATATACPAPRMTARCFGSR